MNECEICKHDYIDITVKTTDAGDSSYDDWWFSTSQMVEAWYCPMCGRNLKDESEGDKEGLCRKITSR